MAAQGPSLNKLTADVSSGWLGKVWCGGPCFHKLKIVQTLFIKQMAFVSLVPRLFGGVMADNIVYPKFSKSIILIKKS